uniref:Uncharacterized protein n=1 Tax=Amphilophus citrinellus TaxID=61819 RepID=A0A3Q0SU83_AMPCI
MNIRGSSYKSLFLLLVTSCGSDGHSMALTETGEVFSWGDGDFGKLGHERLIGLPDAMLKNKSCPQVVPSLEGLFIEDIAVGCEHVLALSSTGDVYAWGCNSEGQILDCRTWQSKVTRPA